MCFLQLQIYYLYGFAERMMLTTFLCLLTLFVLFLWRCAFNIFHSIEQYIAPYWPFYKKWCLLAWLPRFLVNSLPPTLLPGFLVILSHRDSTLTTCLLPVPSNRAVILKHQWVPFSLYMKVLFKYTQIPQSLSQICWKQNYQGCDLYVYWTALCLPFPLKPKHPYLNLGFYLY